VKLSSMVLISRRDLFVSPGAMRYSTFKQNPISEAVGQDSLEEIEVRSRRFGIFQNVSDYNKRRKLV